MNLNITTESALAILGVRPDEAGAAEGINRAYRRMARCVHPDMNDGSEEAARLMRLATFCRDGLIKQLYAPPPQVAPEPGMAQWVRVDLNRRGWWTTSASASNY